MEVSPGREKEPGTTPMKRLISAIVCLVLLNVGPAWGRARQFIPKYVDFSGTLLIKSLYEQDRTKSRNTSSRSDSTFVEAITFSGLGYIYNPLFISMRTSVGLGLKQERIRTARATHSSIGDATTFSHMFKILPSHPYHLDLYFKRTTPMTGGRTGEGASTVIYEYGALAQYEKRPWSTMLNYTNYQTDTATSGNETQAIRYNLNYFQTGFNAGGHYSYNETTRNNGINESKRDSYGVGLAKSFSKVRFRSRWNKDKREEGQQVDGLTVNSTLEQQKLHGSVEVELPYNFKSTLSYDKANRNDLRDQSGVKKLIFNDSKRYNFRLRHRLFKSLTTSFAAGLNTIDSNGGETKQANYYIRGDYSKKMRWGRILSGLWYTLADLDSEGAPTTLEPHEIETGQNYFDLAAPNIDENTIEVRIKDHNNDNILLLLTEGDHYTIAPQLNSFRITITNLPVGLVSPDDIWDYTYLADFAVLNADYVLRTDSWGGSLSLPLFDQRLTPHYSYFESKQKEREGDFPGNPADNKTHTLGLGFDQKPLRGDVTLSWLRANTVSEDRITAYLNYRKGFTPFTSGHLTLTYDAGNIRQNDPDTNQTTELNETMYSAQAQVQTIFPQKNLNGSITGNYSFYTGSGDTTTLSIFSNLIWHVGRLDLYMTASHTDSESNAGGIDTKRQFSSVKVTLKRELF